ncbi:unnamed protein product [Heterobilharzia americana]|nr:unnamed protein product [Heterobilharzia americana]
MSLMTADLSNQIPTVLLMLGIICLIGIFGNILVIIVYALKHDRLTATLFILVLAISDFLACVTLIPGTMLIEYLEWNIDSSFLCKFYYFINNTFIPFSSLLIICIAFDRYFCLCHPFKNILTRQRAKLVILILIFICLILGFSSTFTVRVEKIHFENINNNGNHENQYIIKSMNHTHTLISFDQNLNFSWNSYHDKEEKFECTEIIKLNHTMIDKVLYQIIQKSQTCSYILCIISVVTLYVLIYRSVSKVFKKRLELKGVRKGDKRHFNNTGAQNNNNSLVSNNTPQAKKYFFTRKLKISSNQRDKTPPSKYNFSSSKLVTSQNFPNSDEPVNNRILPSKSSQNIQQFDCGKILIKNEIQEDEKTTSLETQQQSDNQSDQLNLLKKYLSPNLHENNKTVDAQPVNTEITHTVPLNCNSHLLASEEKTRRSMKTIKDNIAFQNLKTAAMLFVVAVVYIVTFIPAMLMAIQYVPLYLPIFYLYYINNAINPIIYGFMNPNFRADIRVLICRKLKCTRSNFTGK